MPLLPAKVLDRKLVWTDFKKTPKTPPGPGVTQVAALTVSNFGGSRLSVKPVAGKKPTVYKVGAATVTVNFVNTSWVADYVLDSWPQNKQDDLLAHEQVHFMITACSGRDFLAELDAISAKEYASTADATTDVQAVMASFDQTIIQGIQDKYDVDTKSSPTANAAIQAKWAKAVEDARANTKPLQATLKTAGLIP
jgi:hypothetical protein